jgi:hypothetical protein
MEDGFAGRKHRREEVTLALGAIADAVPAAKDSSAIALVKSVLSLAFVTVSSGG